jgi:hypothetical protein
MTGGSQQLKFRKTYAKPHNIEFHIFQIFFKSTKTRGEKIDEKLC